MLNRREILSVSSLSLLLFAHSSAGATPATKNDARLSTVPLAAASRMLEQMPVQFEANNGRLHPSVLYYSRSFSSTLLLTRQEALLSAGDAVLRIGLRNSNPSPLLEGEQPASHKSDYFLGNKPGSWRTAVRNYQRIRYKQVYPGIDLLYHGRDRQLEYDFVVAPGADPKQIRVKFSGADKLFIDEKGALQIRAGSTRFEQPRPFVYQQTESGSRTQVAAGYRIVKKNEVAFSLGDYDPRRELVIDPVVTGTYLGGNGVDVAKYVGVEESGDIWVVGYTTSNPFPTAGNPYRDFAAGFRDIFVAKFAPSLSGPESLLYSTYIGGSGDDEPMAAYVDAGGSVFITGYTTSVDFPLAGGSPQSSNAGERDAFVLKLNITERGSASLWYSTYFGGPGHEVGNAIAVDAQGRIYVVGQTSTAANFPVTSNTLQQGNRGGLEGFFAKFNPNQGGAESLLYATYLGGGSTDSASGVAALDENRVLIAGTTLSGDFPIAGDAISGDYRGGGDGFLTILDLSQAGLGALVNSTFFGGGSQDVIHSLAVAGNYAYVQGYTFSSDFPVTDSAAQRQIAGSADLFLTKFDLTLPSRESLVYSTYVGGSNVEVGYGMTVGSAGRVFLTGYTYSQDFPVTGEFIQELPGGGADAFLVKLNTEAQGEASLVYSTYLGGAGMDIGYDAAVHPDGRVLVTGLSQSQGLPVPENAYQPSPANFAEAFLIGIDLCGQPSSDPGAPATDCAWLPGGN